MSTDKPVFDRHSTRSNVLPAREILAVEKLLPLARLGGQGKRGQNDYQKKESGAMHISPRKEKNCLAAEHYSLFAERGK
jgi:hypothetical protein